MEFQKLTVHHYSENKDEERRITLSSSNIALMAAKIEDIKIGGMDVREVTVLMLDGSSVDLVVNHSDLETLEGAIGTYSFG